MACDYDGTIASAGRVDARVVDALEQLKRSGRTLILVTGRIQEDFLDHFPAARLFARVILENGAVIYRPETGETETLARRPPGEFNQRLKDRAVRPLVVGKVIVSTWQPHETTVFAIIRDLGLEMDVVFNKGAVMALPSGVNKATVLEAALSQRDLSPLNVVVEDQHSSPV
jgi:hydroxymethylpyrimidine pyrophosphatase-like HAD family hydrolase